MSEGANILVREELDKKEIRMEVKSGYFLRLFFTTRFTTIIFILWILLFLYWNLFYPGPRLYTPYFIIIFIMVTVLMIYIGPPKTIVNFDREGIEFHLGNQSQKSLWRFLESIEININPKMKKEQIVFREKNRSWEIKNLHYKDDSWDNLKRVVHQYVKEHNIKF